MHEHEREALASYGLTPQQISDLERLGIDWKKLLGGFLSWFVSSVLPGLLSGGGAPGVPPALPK